MSCGVGRRRGLDLALLWLWCRPAAVALIWPLTWEPPYAMGVALKSKKKKKKKKKIRSSRTEERETMFVSWCSLSWLSGERARPGKGQHQEKSFHGRRHMGSRWNEGRGACVVWGAQPFHLREAPPHSPSVFSGQSRNPHNVRPLWICQLQLHWDHAGRPE